jgi:hypothetical protein
MSALFRAAAAVLTSCALGAGAVYGDRALESRGVELFAGIFDEADAVPELGTPDRASPNLDSRGIAWDSGGAAGSDMDADTGGVLVRFAEGRGVRTARLDAVAQACGGTFVLKRGDVAGVGHVIAFIAHEAASGGVEVRRLSAPGDFMRAEAGAGGLRLTSPDGFEGLAWALTANAEPQALGPAARDALDLACADAAAAAARFNAGPGSAANALP